MRTKLQINIEANSLLSSIGSEIIEMKRGGVEKDNINISAQYINDVFNRDSIVLKISGEKNDGTKFFSSIGIDSIEFQLFASQIVELVKNIRKERRESIK